MKTIFITGGTGFLGRNLALKLKNRFRVVLGGRNNAQNLYARNETGCEIYPLDITNIESVRDAFQQIRPQIVIHAAATKFVDLSEKFPFEAIDINVVGSENIARVAIEHKVETVIGISTDKAAPPVTNTYAITKALMERLFCSLNGQTDTQFACVRFGNIAWSSGSVLPLWKRMFDKTKVIESTGPEMRRFIFTVDEASEITIAALDHIATTQGKVLTRNMKAVQIEDMLNAWTKHFGGSWVKIAPRPGDKSDELLFGEAELPFTTRAVYDGNEYFVIDFKTKAPQPEPVVISSLNAERLSEAEILHILKSQPDEIR